MSSHEIFSLSDIEATRLTPNGTHSGMDITIQNVSPSGYIYIGGNNTVSSESFGYRLLPNHAWSIELSGKDDIWAVASAPDVKAAVFIASLESGF